MTGKTILVIGPLRGLGRLAANALAHRGHTVYAIMREVASWNPGRACDARAYAKREEADLQVIKLEVRDQGSVEAAGLRVAKYGASACAGLGQQVRDAIGSMLSEGAYPGTVAGTITRVVDTPSGDRSSDAGENGASVAFPVADLVRNQMLTPMGFANLLAAASRRAQP
ncbi:MAG TPA: hypothetical protein VFL55_19305 [Acetobacteraceae bacterium]|nr:hypothetical protein [Acetobacteraceae bacterium]